MRLYRLSRIVFSLLLVLLLPLQGHAAMLECGPQAGTASETQHHCGHDAGNTHHHRCGNCCAAPIALPYTPQISPLRTPAMTLPAILLIPPSALLDRLDRPPRSSRL